MSFLAFILANESAETFVPVGFKLVRTGFGISGTIGATTSFCSSGISSITGSLTTGTATTTGFDSSVKICVLTVETSVIE